MLKTRLIYIYLLLLFSPCCLGKEVIELASKVGRFTIEPTTLAISLASAENSEKIELTQNAHHFDEVKDLKSDVDNARWYYPMLKIYVRVSTDDHGLHWIFTTNKQQNFQWPAAGLSQQATALIIPDGEGLYVPNRDSFWLKEFKKYPTLSLSMPFCAIQYKNYVVSTMMTEHDGDTEVQVKQKNGQLYLVSNHNFLKRDHFQKYEVFIHATGNSPISPALDYRQHLVENNTFISLKQKILENANVNKLLGAFHVWVWGDGKNIEMLHKFEALGIKHLWIGYDASPVQEGDNIDKTYVQTAENLGYLIAPYDSFSNAQNPKTSDSITSIWPNHLWPEACIRSANGSILSGFRKHGCYLSTEALRLRESKEKNIAQNIATMVNKGDNSLFLGRDAASPLYDDYSKQHPMTRIEDLKNRIERMRYISSTKKLVLGSETGSSWSSGVIAYNNGGFLSFSQEFWSRLKDKKQFGTWWPTSAPNVLFKPYNAPNEFIHASYDPRYRLPLYEAALHNSVVTTDRWELNELKIPALMQTKALLQTLYNIPPIWVLDKKKLKENANYFSAYYQFFSPLHQMAGLEPLSQFNWLTKNRLVQKTQFGNRLILTANFSKKTYAGIGAGCIQAQWKEDGSTHSFCPTDYYD